MEFNMFSRCAAEIRLFRSDSKPVSRGGRPNSSKKGLVMLPSGRAIERCPSGRKVYGSGIAQGILLRRARHLADGIDEHFSFQAADG